MSNTEIEDTYSLYARAIDEKRYELLKKVFHPEAQLQYIVGSQEFVCSGSESTNYFRNFLNLCFWTSHLIGSPSIELDGKKVMAEMSPITNIITDMFPKPIAKTLVVKHSSKADKLNVRCLMLDDFNIEIEVENNTYYLIEDQDIIGMYG